MTDGERNRAAWDAISDEYQAEHRSQLEDKATAWGVWSLPECELQLLGDVAGRDAEYWRLLTTNDFVVERLLEPQPPDEPKTTYSNFAPIAWSREFPAELMIAARKLPEDDPTLT